MTDGQELIDIIETVYRGCAFIFSLFKNREKILYSNARFFRARKGRGLVISPRDYSTKYKY